jgi:hypothetical protein
VSKSHSLLSLDTSLSSRCGYTCSDLDWNPNIFYLHDIFYANSTDGALSAFVAFFWELYRHEPMEGDIMTARYRDGISSVGIRNNGLIKSLVANYK